MKIYLVGGAVRDQLLGLTIKDRDYLVVGSSPEQLLAQGYQSVGKDSPVFLHPKTKQEYALARTERKQGQGYTRLCLLFCARCHAGAGFIAPRSDHQCHGSGRAERRNF